MTEHRWMIVGQDPAPTANDLPRAADVPPPPPVFILDPALAPIGLAAPCPATMVAVLGFPEPTTIPCGRLAGHDGPHEKSFRWGDSDRG